MGVCISELWTLSVWIFVAWRLLEASGVYCLYYDLCFATLEPGMSFCNKSTVLQTLPVTFQKEPVDSNKPSDNGLNNTCCVMTATTSSF